MSHGRRAGRILLRWLPALAWMAVIFGLSSISGLRASPDAEVDRPLRVLAHLGTYAILGALVLWALTGGLVPSGRDAVTAFAVAVLYGVSDEIHQAFVPERSGQLTDVAIDAVGAALGVAVAWFALGRGRPSRFGPHDDPV